MKALLIAEKPSLMREIQKVYQMHQKELDYTIDFTAQAGHLLGLKSPKEINTEKYGKWSFDNIPEIYPYEYKISEGKNKLVYDIKTMIKSGNYQFIIHAGDPDQEGQLLIEETLDFIQNTLPVKRFWTNDLTEGAILQALLHLKDNLEYQSLNQAALLRQHADYQFGMNCTQGISLKYGELCQIGRVKAPIIRMIVDRELAIENYVEKITYKPAFDYQGYEFVNQTVFEKEEDALHFNPNVNSAFVQKVEVKTKKQKAPKLFKLSTLQIAAHKALHLSGQETLQLLQNLYEAKSVSYPRSDCEYISSAVDVQTIKNSVLKEISVSTDLLVKSAKEIQSDKTYCNDKAIASEGHTAIIPTGLGCHSSNPKERTLYELICRQFLAIFAKEKESQTTRIFAIPEQSDKVYENSETIDLEPGYEFVLNPEYKIRTKINDIAFSKDMKLCPITFKAKECKTTPPSRYNDGTLIKALDNPEGYEDDENGKIKYTIGTPATRANIIEQCQKNGYFEKKKGSFYATEKGKNIVKTFQNISLFNITESAKWEVLLQSVRNGADMKTVENQFIQQMLDTVTEIKNVTIEKRGSSSSLKSIGNCPKCGAPVSVGKFGPFCTAKCGMTLGKIYNHTLTEKQVQDLLNNKKVLIKGLTSKNGNKYDAYFTPTGIRSYDYQGTTKYCYEFEQSFPPKK